MKGHCRNAISNGIPKIKMSRKVGSCSRSTETKYGNMWIFSKPPRLQTKFATQFRDKEETRSLDFANFSCTVRESEMARQANWDWVCQKWNVFEIEEVVWCAQVKCLFNVALEILGRFYYQINLGLSYESLIQSVKEENWIFSPLPRATNTYLKIFLFRY